MLIHRTCDSCLDPRTRAICKSIWWAGTLRKSFIFPNRYQHKKKTSLLAGTLINRVRESLSYFSILRIWQYLTSVYSHIHNNMPTNTCCVLFW